MQTDRILRSLFVALAVGLGWGIRGDFGHQLGAMFPGAALGLGFAYVSGQKSMFKWMPLLGLIGGLGIATGGTMSYGLLHGYAKADTLINYAYGFFTLFLEGGAWGCFGCAFIGLALEKDRLKASELFAIFLTIVLGGILLYVFVVNLIGFHINPGRNDISIGFTGGTIGLFLWLAFNNRPLGMRGAVLGYIGFGLGMAYGRLLGNASYALPFTINHWNIMEVMCGFIGGFIFTYGMLGKRFDEPPKSENYPLLNIYGIFYVMFLIPFLHFALRVNPVEKKEQWIQTLTRFGVKLEDFQLFYIDLTMIMVYLVCFIAFVGAGIWLYIHLKEKYTFAAFPLLFFSFLMLLIQYLNAFYFIHPYRIMHNVNLVFLVLMVIYAVCIKKEEFVIAEEKYNQFRPWKWLIGAVAAYLILLVLASFINGEETMRTANTRFPLWSWRDGPQ